jgi:hypothetical protein
MLNKCNRQHLKVKYNSSFKNGRFKDGVKKSKKIRNSCMYKVKKRGKARKGETVSDRDRDSSS